MSEADKQVARRLIAQMDSGHFDVFDELCAPDYQCHVAGAAAPQTRDEHREAARAFYRAFPDMRHEIHHVVAEAGVVILRATPRGTHRGEFLGVPASGRPVHFDVVATFHIEHGRIKEEWVLADLMGLKQQLTSGL